MGRPVILFEDLDNRELVRLCQANTRPAAGGGGGADGGGRDAWDEFFRRFMKTIEYAIRGVLSLAGGKGFANDKEAVWDIHERVVVKLYRDGILSKCVNPDGVGYWLAEVSRNQARDWIREQMRDKRLPAMMEVQCRKYLDEKAPPESEEGFHGDIGGPPPGFLSEPSITEQVVERLESIPNGKIRWALRLSFLSFWPLSPEEKKDLSVFAHLQEAEVARRIDEVTRDLDKSTLKSMADSGRAVILLHKANKLEASLPYLKGKHGEQAPEYKKVIQKIEKARSTRERLLRDAAKIRRPSNEWIASFLDIPPDKANQVSVLLSRGKQILLKAFPRAGSSTDKHPEMV